MSTEAKTLLSYRQAILIFIIEQDAGRVHSYGFTIDNIIDCSLDVRLCYPEGASDVVVLASWYETDGDALLVSTSEHAVDYLIESSVSSNNHQGTIGLYVLKLVSPVEWIEL